MSIFIISAFLVVLITVVRGQLGSDPVYENSYNEKSSKNKNNIHGKFTSPAGKRQECLREIQTEIIDQFRDFLEKDGHIGNMIYYIPSVKFVQRISIIRLC
jgi:hypothetical protein